MRAEAATGNEIMVVCIFAAAIAAGIAYVMNPPMEVKKVEVVKPKPRVKKVADIGPGWASGRWLGSGDFQNAEKTQHPFADQPRYAGHPFHMRDLDQASPGPKLPMH